MKETNCKKCNRQFLTKKYRIANGKRIFCSLKCKGEAKRGTKVSEETLIKMRIMQKGDKHHRYWLGRKRSPEHIAKMIAGRKAKAIGNNFDSSPFSCMVDYSVCQWV